MRHLGGGDNVSQKNVLVGSGGVDSNFVFPLRHPPHVEKFTVIALAGKEIIHQVQLQFVQIHVGFLRRDCVVKHNRAKNIALFC